MKIPCSLGFDWSLCKRLIHKSLAWHPARQLRASLGIMLPSLNNQRLRLIEFNLQRFTATCHTFKVSFEQLEIEKYILSVYQFFQRCFKEFPSEYSLLTSFESKFTKVYKVFCVIFHTFVLNNYKISKLVEILIEYSNFFLSLAYLEFFSQFYSKICFFSRKIRYSCFRTNHCYIRIISCRIVKLANKSYVTSSQGNYISTFVSKTSPFPKQNWVPRSSTIAIRL